ncbi:MAG: acyl-CoA desaturase [Phycisphaerales bacterium]
MTNLAAVLIPFVGLAAAIFLLWGIAFNWVYLAIMALMYGITAIGITVGYHRYFTHKSFDTPRWVVALLGVFGSMAVQGPILEWAAVHRRHHQHSDDMDDPHSPHTHGSGIWGTLKGFWHSHMGWLFSVRQTHYGRYVPDLTKDKLVSTISRTFTLWVVLGLAIPTVLGGVLTLSWGGALLGLIWGGLVRVFFVHHVTWSVNSICHIWGSRPFESHDHSRNNAIFGVLAMGEGWHNNHHAFPTSARHGLRWWEFDASYLFICLLGLFGLARNIRVPSPERMAAKLRA